MCYGAHLLIALLLDQGFNDIIVWFRISYQRDCNKSVAAGLLTASWMAAVFVNVDVMTVM